MRGEMRINNYVIQTPIIEMLQDIQSKLLNGKLRDIRERGDEIVATCPFHKDGKEEKPSCYVYCGDSKDGLASGTFHCFTCGEKGPFWKFVAACFGKSDEWAKSYLSKNYGKYAGDSAISIDPIELPKQKASIYKTSLFRSQGDKRLEREVDGYQSWHPYMAKRKLSRQVCETFQIKYDPVEKCIVFPVWDDQGNLVMLTRRSVMSKMFRIDADKQKPVYLLNHLKKNNISTAYVCESQINCLYLWSLGYPAIALFGTGSQQQYQILNRSGIEHYYLCFDGDQAGDNGIKRFLANIKPSVLVDIYVLPRGKDMNDLSAEEISALPIIDRSEFESR